MKIVVFILNIPWTLFALFLSAISLPMATRIMSDAVVVRVKSFWWHPAKGIRALTLGNVIMLGTKLQPHDLEHEYVHIEQHMREPFIHPFLAFIEIRKNGFRHSKYEKEAYERAGNKFVEL